MRPETTLEEARVRITKYNKTKKLQTAVGAAKRYVENIKIKSAFLNVTKTQEFSRYLENYHFGSAKHHQRIMHEWSFIQKLIADMKLLPEEYSDNKRRIYGYLSERKFSLDYSKKLLRILNMWGHFVCRKQGKYYEPIVAPKGVEKQRILEAYTRSPRCRSGGSLPLTSAILEKLKENLPNRQWRWLYISVWFGLRPIEVDSLNDPSKYKIETNHELNIKVLWVYQSKLTSVTHERRWKPIPIVYAPQEKALEYIVNGEKIDRPCLKTLQKYIGHSRIGLYGGRKGFTDLMLSLGQKIEDISVWMGHTSIEVTWRYYKNKRLVSFTRPNVKLDIKRDLFLH